MLWYALFSQTGSEIYQISEKLNRYPDMIICNKQDGLETINQGIIGKAPIIFTDKKPTTEQYLQLIPEDALTTMHGWLRIVPGEVCDKRRIVNGHPGLITEYPELIGKDPQQKAIDLGLEYSGSILHEAIAEVDSGQIIGTKKIKIKGLTDDEVFANLHEASVNLWVDFLKVEFTRDKVCSTLMNTK